MEQFLKATTRWHEAQAKIDYSRNLVPSAGLKEALKSRCGQMTAELCTLIAAFASCLSQGRAFHWFAFCLLGMMVRLDHHGVTAFVHWLKLDPKLYNGLLNFFHASSCNLSLLMRCWQLLSRAASLVQFNGAAIIGLDVRCPGTKYCISLQGTQAIS